MVILKMYVQHNIFYTQKLEMYCNLHSWCIISVAINKFIEKRFTYNSK